MTKHLLGTAIACLLLTSCAGTPTNDAMVQTGATDRNAGDGRLNAMAGVALERDLRELERAHAAERSGLIEKLREMGSELADLRSKLQAAPPLQAAQEPPAMADASGVSAGNRTGSPNGNSTVGASTGTDMARHSIRLQHDARVGKPVMAAKSAPHAPPLSGFSRANRETIVIHENGMIFRVMHDFAKTEFHPSPSLQQQLLQAARAGKHIEIRGRTDASSANDVDRNIALQRALNARTFLANHGIHPRKMHIDYLAAGGQVADNSTADGRARNRRVEIETAGITPDVLEDIASIIRQDLQ